MAESLDTINTRTTTDNNADIAYQSFGMRSPFMTILYQSIGPFGAEIVGASYGIVDTYWISRYVHDAGNAAMVFGSLADQICRAFGMFMSTAASSKLSFLRGESRHGEIPQVFADLIKVTLLLCLLCPGILLPLIKPMMNFFDLEGSVRDCTNDYLFLAISGSPCTILNLFFCGAVQSEGRTLLYGSMQITSFVLNMAVFDPLFIGILDMGMKGAALSNILSDAIPMLILAILFIFKKLDTQCTMADLCRCKCSPHTCEAVKVGFTQFVSHICFSLPSFFSRKYLEISANESSNPTKLMAGLNPSMKFWYLPGCYAVALSIAILPCISYALGRKDGKRVKALLFIGLFMSLLWCSIFEVFMFFLRKYYAMIFTKDTELIDIISKFLLYSYIACAVMGIEMVCASFVQAMKYAVLATVLSILTRFVPVPLFGTLLFYIKKSKDIYRVLLMYPCADVFSCFVGLLFIIYPFTKVNKVCQESYISHPLLHENAQQEKPIYT